MFQTTKQWLYIYIHLNIMIIDRRSDILYIIMGYNHYFNHLRMASLGSLGFPILGAVGVWASKAQRASLWVFGAGILLGPIGAKPATPRPCFARRVKPTSQQRARNMELQWGGFVTKSRMSKIHISPPISSHKWGQSMNLTGVLTHLRKNKVSPLLSHYTIKIFH